VAAAAADAQKKQAEADAEKAAAERPPVLSAHTTQLLRELSQALRAAPALTPPSTETLSSL
jgi:penicillin-binding protein 1A